MKNLFFFFALLLFSVTTKAQTTFYKVIDSVAGQSFGSVGAVPDSDGGYMLVGATTSAICLIKTNATGDTVWTKTYKSSTATTGYTYSSACFTTDQGWIIVGHKIGLSDIYVLKVDAAGTIQWEKFIGTTTLPEIPNSVQQTSDGGYVITALQHNTPSIPPSAYIVKLDAGGAVQWNTILSIPGQGNNSGNIYATTETNDGGYLLTGEADTIASNKSSAYLLKLDHTGTLQWSKLWSGSNGDKVSGAVLTPDNGFLISGTKRSSGGMGFGDMTITKTDSMGNISWCKAYSDVGGAVSKTSSGSFVVSGIDFRTAKMLFASIDSNGNVLWNRTIWDPFATPLLSILSCGGPSQTSDGGYILTGGAGGPGGGTKAYFFKTDAVGSPHCNDSTITITVSPYLPIVSTPVVTSSTGFSTSAVTTVVRSAADVITTYCISTGVEEKQNEISAISVYPNPSAGIFNFNGLEKGSTIQISDLSGRIISKIISMNDIETIDLNGKAKGIYFYTVITDEKLVQRGKIIID